MHNLPRPIHTQPLSLIDSMKKPDVLSKLVDGSVLTIAAGGHSLLYMRVAKSCLYEYATRLTALEFDMKPYHVLVSAGSYLALHTLLSWRSNSSNVLQSASRRSSVAVRAPD